MEIAVQSILSPGFIEQSMFHPKIACYPDGRLLLTIQSIGGSDYYGPVLASYSQDRGYSWSKPEPIPTLGWSQPDASGVVEGTCDVVPDFDPASGRMLAIGHNVFYRDNHFYDTYGDWNRQSRNDKLPRRACYCVQQNDGSWGDRKLLVAEEFADRNCFVCGCSQKVIRAKGEWLLPFYLRLDNDNQACSVAVYRARFDGQEMRLGARGNILELAKFRGLLEPSLCEFQGKLYLTLRAEDGNAYWSRAGEDLCFEPIQPWGFDDGTCLVTSSTQQHFLSLGGKLFLLYVRNNGRNAKVPRFRAPLYLAEVDTAKMQLCRDSEQVVLPMDGDWRKPETVSYSGNFLPRAISDREALVSDASIKPKLGYQGLTQIARIYTA